jgi:hypothetical protein
LVVGCRYGFGRLASLVLRSVQLWLRGDQVRNDLLPDRLLQLSLPSSSLLPSLVLHDIVLPDDQLHDRL